MSEPLKLATIFRMAKGVLLIQDETKQITKLLSTDKSTCFIAKKFKRDHCTIKKFIEKSGVIRKKASKFKPKALLVTQLV